MRTKRSPLVLATGIFLLTTGTPSFASTVTATGSATPPSSALSAEMVPWMKSLDAKQRRRACYAFEDAERFDLRLAPLFLEGLRLDQMTAPQVDTFGAALEQVLSPRGEEKVATIRSLEDEVRALETGLIGFFMDARRDPLRYFLSVYGDPATDQAWGLRFDGHHLSLNWTVVPDAPLSVTPLFLGGQPLVVPESLERAGLRVLAAEEDAGLAILAALDAPERKIARLPFAEGSAIHRPLSKAEGAELVPLEAAGIAAHDVSAAARERMAALVDVALENFRPAVAAPYRARLFAEAASWRFAFATPPAEDGGAKAPAPSRPLYYRLQSEAFLIEFDNTSPAADHAHFVFRERDGDFGRDVLREHREQHPH